MGDISNLNFAPFITFLLYTVKSGFSGTKALNLLLGRKHFSSRWNSFLLCCSRFYYLSLVKRFTLFLFFSYLIGKGIVKRFIDFLVSLYFFDIFYFLMRFKRKCSIQFNFLMGNSFSVS